MNFTIDGWTHVQLSETHSILHKEDELVRLWVMSDNQDMLKLDYLRGGKSLAGAELLNSPLLSDEQIGRAISEASARADFSEAEKNNQRRIWDEFSSWARSEGLGVDSPFYAYTDSHNVRIDVGHFGALGHIYTLKIHTPNFEDVKTLWTNIRSIVQPGVGTCSPVQSVGGNGDSESPPPPVTRTSTS